MASNLVDSIIAQALALKLSHGHVTALDILDLVMRSAAGAKLEFVGRVQPPEEFALLVAEAFDRGMSVQEWRDWTGPLADPRMREMLLVIWHDEVWPEFLRRYGLGERGL